MSDDIFQLSAMNAPVFNVNIYANRKVVINVTIIGVQDDIEAVHILSTLSLGSLCVQQTRYLHNNYFVYVCMLSVLRQTSWK